jgi:hypothetical protein
MKSHFILHFCGLETLQPDITSDDTAPLSRRCLIHNMITLKTPKLLAYTTPNNKFPAPMLSRDYGWHINKLHRDFRRPPISS